MLDSIGLLTTDTSLEGRLQSVKANSYGIELGSHEISLVVIYDEQRKITRYSFRVHLHSL